MDKPGWQIRNFDGPTGYSPGEPNTTVAGLEYSFATACRSPRQADCQCDAYKAAGVRAFWRKKKVSNPYHSEIWQVFIHPPVDKFQFATASNEPPGK